MNPQQKNVHYFPGHMKKALESLSKLSSAVDLVIEVADARAPLSSRNPLLQKAISAKPRLIVLTKTDYADPSITEAWKQYFRNSGLVCISINLKKEKALPIIKAASEPLVAKKREKEKRLGMKEQPVRLLVVGVPNVGKSTLINNLAGKNVAKVENRPGVTRAEQWIKLPSSFILFDTPGILPMNYEDQMASKKLAIMGSIKESVLPIDDLALTLISFLASHYPFSLKERYGIDDLRLLPPSSVLSIMANKRGYLLKGGASDLTKASTLLLDEFQNGILGRFSLESPLATEGKGIL